MASRFVQPSAFTSLPVTDSGELALSADEEMDIQQVYRWLALTRCIVRHMLTKERLPG